MSTEAVLQLESIDEELRTAIWNCVHTWFKLRVDDSGDYDPPGRLASWAAIDVLNVPVDSIPEAYHDAMRWWRNHFLGDGPWWQVYDLIEFLAQAGPAGRLDAERFRFELNTSLERHGSGYRFVNEELAPISHPEEIEAIETAMESSRAHELHGTHTHIATAVAALSKKPNPDYRNSIKESISAVESAVIRVSGLDGGKFGPALVKLKEELKLHPAMSEGFNKLFGYTSDEDGIRHAILEQSTVGFDEAKFMVVTCSAFVNFLIAKADAAKLL